ncbi:MULTISPECIES: STAS domain-containing protein [unclassified Roseovarius]|uniref:STAS domain-containing protein n=1 Tax=unclassified Roseovarius TaxID=2614913 RepID=UPI00273E2183|nr:STAS domain-containing protein [Roseovarius sp. MMSF_3350]
MQLTCATHNNINVITVEDNRIDAASAIRFKDEMRTLTDEGPEHVVLDLSGVTFVDSSGLGAIVASMKQLGDGRRLDLAGLTPDVAKVFRLTRMDSIFAIHADMAAALQRGAG